MSSPTAGPIRIPVRTTSIVATLNWSPAGLSTRWNGWGSGGPWNPRLEHALGSTGDFLSSLIRRRSRPIVSRTPTPSGSRPHHRDNFTDVAVDREIDGAQTNRLTAGPSISADGGRSQELAASVERRLFDNL